jgi:hypothetical protein
MAKWKDVPGFEGFYEASSDGSIRNKITGYIISGKNGIVKLSRGDGNKVITTIPRIILQTFRGDPPSSLHFAVRLDRNPENNSLKNLAWKTRSEFPPKAKLNQKTAKEIRRLAKKGYSAAELADNFGVRTTTIRSVLNGQTWGNA